MRTNGNPAACSVGLPSWSALSTIQCVVGWRSYKDKQYDKGKVFKRISGYSQDDEIL